VTGCALCALAREHGGACPVHGAPGWRDMPAEDESAEDETRNHLDSTTALDMLLDGLAVRVEIEHRNMP
jgi:hypothetical protein